MAMLLVDYKQKEIHELGPACAAAEVAMSCCLLIIGSNVPLEVQQRDELKLFYIQSRIVMDGNTRRSLSHHYSLVIPRPDRQVHIVYHNERRLFILHVIWSMSAIVSAFSVHYCIRCSHRKVPVVLDDESRFGLSLGRRCLLFQILQVFAQSLQRIGCALQLYRMHGKRPEPRRL